MASMKKDVVADIFEVLAAQIRSSKSNGRLKTFKNIEKIVKRKILINKAQNKLD